MTLKKSHSRYSIALPSICLVVVIVMVLCPASSLAQPIDTTDCDAIRDEVQRLREKVFGEDEGWEDLAERADEALKCYDGHIEGDWAVWLVLQRVFALDGLRRYTEALEVVDQFISTANIDADSSFVARLFMWDLRFKHLDGRFADALESYRQGLRYASHLPIEMYRHYMLNAGSVHIAEGKFTEALIIYGDVRQAFGGFPSDSTLFEVYGRSLLGEAEANLDLLLHTDQAGIDLEAVIEQLSQASNIFGLVQSHDRSATANATLGLAHALNGDYQKGTVFFDLAALVIDGENLHRERILLYYCRAQASFLKKEYTAVHTELDEALTLGERYAIAEFKSRLHLLKGQTYEKADQMKEALAAYREAFNVAKDSSQGRDQYVYDLASESAFRIADQLPEETESPFAFLTLGFFGVVALVIALFGLLAYFVWMALHRKKKEQPALPSEPDAAPEVPPVPTSKAAPTPEPSPAPAAPEEPTVQEHAIPSREHFDQVADAVGFPRESDTRERMHLAYQIRSNPDGFRALVEHPVAHERLSRLKEGEGSSRNDVWACIEFYEEERGTQFTGARPGNAVGSQLRQQFGKLGIDWPQSLSELDRLLGLA